MKQIQAVHRLRRGDRLETLSAHYHVPVCMIMRANGLARPEHFARMRVLKIPHQSFCSAAPNKAYTDCET